MRELLLITLPAFHQHSNHQIFKIGILIIILLSPNILFGQMSKFDSILVEAGYLYELKEYKKASLLLDQAFLLNQKSNRISNYFAARIYSLTNDIDKSIKYLERALSTDRFNPNFFLYDEHFDNIRKDRRVKELEHKIKDGGIDFFDIINDLQLKDEVVYINKKIFLGWEMGYNISGRAGIYSMGLADYSYKDLLERAGRKDFNFENKKLIISQSDFGKSPYSPLSFLKLKELTITRCTGTAIHINRCEIESFNYGKQGLSSRNEVISLSLKNSKINSIYISNNSLASLYVDSIDVKKLELYIGVGSSLSEVNISNSIIGDGQNPVLLKMYPEYASITNNIFESSVSFLSSEFSKNVEIESNKFKGHLDISNSIFPEFHFYLPYRQLSQGLYINNTDSTKNYYTSRDNLEDEKLFEQLLNSYQYLFNNYRQRGELKSANLAYVAIKNLNLDRQKYTYEREGGFRNLFRLRLAQIMKFYTNHGTDPSLAMLISFYIILIFAVFYFFFPSEWDTTSKARLLSNFKDFRQKNEKGYIKPFFVMFGGFAISLINALTLSLNSFVTLGFGTIPTKGLARYVCIIQGFIGWFLLSIFTVALINQVLA